MSTKRLERANGHAPLRWLVQAPIPNHVPDFIRDQFISVRRRERALLCLAAAFVGGSLLALSIAQDLSQGPESSVPGPNHTLLLFLVWGATLCTAHLALNWTRPLRDPLLLPVAGLLTGWGLVMIERLAPGFALRQMVWVIVSVAGMLFLAVFPRSLKWLYRFRYTWAILGLLTLGLTLILGVNPSGSGERLWLGGPVIFFQPSEIMRLLLLVFLASYLSDKRVLLQASREQGPWFRPILSYAGPMLTMWGLSMVLLLWQHDLGAASLFFLLFICLLYLATGETFVILVGLVLLIVAGVVAYRLFAVVQLRVDTWLNPWPEARGRAFQLAQSLYAFAAGGFLGQGIGQGMPTFIPVVHSDFVFSAIAEEYGLAGSLAIIGLFATLVYRGLRVALTSRRAFHTLLAAGIATNFGLQSLIIMAGTLKLIPLTGITLPFVSYGGSALLVSFLMVGLLLHLADEARRASDWLVQRTTQEDSGGKSAEC